MFQRLADQPGQAALLFQVSQQPGIAQDVAGEDVVMGKTRDIPRKRLQEHPPEALVQRSQHKDIRRLVVGGDFLVRDGTDLKVVVSERLLCQCANLGVSSSV